MAQEKPPRLGTCKDCGAQTVGGQRGKIPELCPQCRYARQLAASKAWKVREDYTDPRDRAEKARQMRAWRAANPERERANRRRTYEKAGTAANTAKVADYRRRNPGKHAEIENRRRARLLAQFVAPVDFAEIWDRDNATCQLCWLPVDVSEASLDHIIPLAKGGTHEPANVQLAHRRCNSRKGARLLTPKETYDSQAA